MKLALTGAVVSEEKISKSLDDDGRRRPTYHVSSSMSLRLRGAKNGRLYLALFVSKLCLLLWAIAIAWFPWQPQYSSFTQRVNVLSLNCEIVEFWGIQPLKKYFSVFIFILILHYFPINKFSIMKGHVCIISNEDWFHWLVHCKGVVISWNTMVTIISLI